MAFRLANHAGRAALLVGTDLYDVATISKGDVPSDPMAALAYPERLSELAAVARPHAPRASLASATLGPPVPRPAKVFAIGLNYRAHANEAEMTLPAHPLVFTKFPSCLVGPTAEVRLRSDRCDYEGELVVVIGRGGRDIAKAEAMAHVLGFMVGQDFSDRRTQFASEPPHFALGKSFDTFGPTGPVLVSRDAVTHDALQIRVWVNDEERQNDMTSNLIFDVPTLVAYLSRVTTLATGDLIFTGTPEGIGAMQRRYLADNDVVRTTIEGLGTLVNRCVRVGDHGLADLVP